MDTVPEVFTVGTSDSRDPAVTEMAQRAAAAINPSDLDAHPLARGKYSAVANRLPFAPIYPWPRAVFYVLLAAQNDVATIEIPSDAIALKLTVSASIWYTEKGGANGLTSAQLMAAGNDKFSADRLITNQMPTDWTYCRGMKACSVKAVATSAHVSFAFIMADQI